LYEGDVDLVTNHLWMTVHGLAMLELARIPGYAPEYNYSVAHDGAARDDANRLVAIHGIVRDVTRERAAGRATEAALERERQASRHLREVDELKAAFLRAVSHELRTPLTSVIGYLETLASRGGQLPRALQNRMLSRALANAQNLRQLITDLLDLDRLASGRLAVRAQPVDLRVLVDRVMAAFESIERSGHHVDVEVVGGTASVDAVKVERILSNLIGNALRHTPAGTRVWVRVEQTPSGFVSIRVEDDGPGIAEDERHRLFLPFEQGETTRASASPGTGIGLALVARFAELHGGYAAVSERPGGGASFVVQVRELVLPGGTRLPPPR
jgi:signal transduction histidine kinase